MKDKTGSMGNARTNLIEAERKAEALFKEAELRGYFKPGKTEKELNKEIFKLAFEMFNVKKHWHKRIVRAGPNTLHPYRENPPALTLKEDDIVFLDFGPVFEEWEADFGRTYVIGNDPLKHKLKNDVESAWHEGSDWFKGKTSLTGAAYYNYACGLAEKYGWQFGGPIAGHLVGKFPHEKVEGRNKVNYIHPHNHKDMFAPDINGEKREWILEIHFIDKEKQIGGFFEQLLRN